jgi:hypothetical protein
MLIQYVMGRPRADVENLDNGQTESSLEAALGAALREGRVALRALIDANMSCALVGGDREKSVRLAIEAVHGALTKEGLFEELVQAILSDNKWFCEVKQNSYQHENGFWKVVLLEGQHFKLRAHIWTPSSMLPAQENVHDHNWSFRSHTLFGELPFEILKVAESGEAAWHYLYRKGTGGQTTGAESYSADFQGEVNLLVTLNGEHCAGTAYFMGPLTMHRILPPVVDTATFVMTGPRLRKECGLYASAPLDDTEDVKPPRIDTTQLRELLDSIQTVRGGA